MRALVISGGGSKGAFAGGVAQYLLEEKGHEYDLFLGTSTGSLLITHLALNKIQKVKRNFTAVRQEHIFDNCPFYIRETNGVASIGIHHFNVLKNFVRGRKTFGESNNLRKLIASEISLEEFYSLKDSAKDIYITVSNLSTNKVEYKSLRSCSYEDYIDWIWISCNYVPFMSLVTKNHCEYADGGLGCIIPIEKAIALGATEVTSEYQTPSGQTRRIGPFSQILRQSTLLLRTTPSGRSLCSSPSSLTSLFNSFQVARPASGSQHFALVGVAQSSRWWLTWWVLMPPGRRPARAGCLG